MTAEDFLAAIDQNPEPPDHFRPELRALWLTRKGRWDQAHALVNDIPSPMGSWIHAHLHRVEGDLGNAAYWYARAGKPALSHRAELPDEWLRLVQENLAPKTAA